MTNAITSFASNAYASLPTLKLDTPSNIRRHFKSLKNDTKDFLSIEEKP